MIAQEFRLVGASGIGPFEYPYLLVAVSPLHAREVSQNGTHELSLQDGDIAWQEQTGIKIENEAGNARFVIIGFPGRKTQ
jgi:hypothetical protein